MKNRLPSWFHQEMPDATVLGRLGLLSEFRVNTVCQEAKCPNLSHCFSNDKLTFMILGDTCTRNCRFCAVNKATYSNIRIDEDEPYRISQVAWLLGLKYVVITSVSRDDLIDGGASAFAKTIRLIKGLNKAIKIETLIPDFQGRASSLECILEIAPDVVAHNIETIRRLYGKLRPQADYYLSLSVLTKIKELNPDVMTKSSIMLGLGEREEEVISTMKDLLATHCDFLTLGQYLAPSASHYPVEEFINIGQFQKYQEIGLALGFKRVLSGPLVRSSYQAEGLFNTKLATEEVGKCTT